MTKQGLPTILAGALVWLEQASMTPPKPSPVPPSEAPHPVALPPGAVPLDVRGLAHIPFPAGFRARRGLNWFAIGLLYASFYMCRYNLPLANKSISDEFHFDNQQMGWIISLNALAYGFGQIINGLLTDKIGGKKAMLIGAAGTIIVNILFGAASFAGWLALFVALWGLNGYVQAFGAPGMVKMNAAWFAKQERGTFAGIFGFMINLGLVSINFLGPALMGGFTVFAFIHVSPLHWRWLFWVPSLICALVALFMAATVAETPEQAGYDYAGSHDAENDAGTTADYGLVFRTIVRNPTVWITACAYACTGAVRQSVQQWYPKYMQTVHHVQLESTSFQVLAFLVPFVASAGSLSSGIVSDRFFQGRRTPVAAFLYVIETIIILLAAQFHTADTAVLFFVLISFTANSTHSLLGTAQAMDIGGRKMAGFASGVIDSFQYFGGSLAGVALGALIDARGWGTYFYFMAPFGVIGALLMIFSARHASRTLAGIKPGAPQQT